MCALTARIWQKLAKVFLPYFFFWVCTLPVFLLHPFVSLYYICYIYSIDYLSYNRRPEIKKLKKTKKLRGEFSFINNRKCQLIILSVFPAGVYFFIDNKQVESLFNSSVKCICFFEILFHGVWSRFSLERRPVNSTLIHSIVTWILTLKVTNKLCRRKFAVLFLSF